MPFCTKELAGIWHQLNTPMLASTGLARDMLLVAHSSYLRRLLETLAELEGRRPWSIPMQQHRP